MSNQDVGRLLVSCRDRPGLVAAVSGFLHARGANIIRSDQDTTDPSGGAFFLRIVFSLPEFRRWRDELEDEFAREVAEPFEISFRLRSAEVAPRVALFVSKIDHCLLDLLWRWRRGELDIDVVQVVSNHPDLADEVASFGVPYAHIPVTRETKPEAEAALLDLVREERIDLVVLARYMQILSDGLCQELAGRAINIHHSMLPSFKGARPYHQAHARGVKFIGATAHYVTADLDEGPIIEQDVHRVDHSSTERDMVGIGQDVEAQVLARAVRWHAEHRVLLDGHRTVVFR